MFILYYPNDLNAIVIIANPKNSDVSTILSNLSMILVYYDVNVSCLYLIPLARIKCSSGWSKLQIFYLVSY